MIHKCGLCNFKTLIFIWSTSKVIDTAKFKELAAKINLNHRGGVPLCWACVRKYNLIEGTKNEE